MRCFFLILVLVLSGCDTQTLNNDLTARIKDGMDFQYTNIDYGYYKQYFFDGSDVNEVKLSFDIQQIYEGEEWMPLNSLMLLDQSNQQKLNVMYMVDSSGEYMNVELKVGKNIYFDETFDLDYTIDSFEVSWTGREVQIRAKEFEFAMGVPFDIKMIGNGISSMEVINSVELFNYE